MAFFSVSQPRVSFFDSPASFFATLRQGVGRRASGVGRRRRIGRIRRELSRLSDRDLADIGITRGDIDTVARQATDRV